MATIAELVTKFIADTSSFTRGTQRVKKDTQSLGGAASNTGKKLGGMNIGALKAAAGFATMAAAIAIAIRVTKQAIKTFAEFEQSMANVRAVTKATDEEFWLLNQAAKNAGETTRFSANQAAEALYFLASAGLSATESVEALEGVLLLAGATGSDLGTTAATMTAIVSQFSLATEDSTRVSNVFAAAIANSQATMSKLSTAFLQVGPVAAGLGITLEETTGALQVLFNAGFKGQQAGRALKSALADLANESGVANQKLSALGVAFDTVNPEAVGLSASIRALSEAGLSTAEVIDVFGKVAGPQLSVLIKEGADALDEYTVAVTATNEAAEQYAIQNDTLAGDADLLKSATKGLAIEFGEGLAPAMRTLIKSVIGIIQLLKPLIRFTADVTGVMLNLAFTAIKFVTDNIGFLGREISRLLDYLERLGVDTEKAADADEELGDATEKTTTILQERARTQQELIRLTDIYIAKQKELREAEAKRIAVIVDAREAAQKTFDETMRSIEAELSLGIISQEDYTKKVIAANKDLIASILDVGIEANYADLVNDQVIEDAVGNINKLTAEQNLLNQERENQIAIEEQLEDASKARGRAALEAAKKEAQALDDAKIKAEELKQVYIEIVTGIPGQIAQIFDAISTLQESQVDAAVQALDAEGAARIAAGEDEVAVRKDIEKQKAAIEYKGALAAWRLQLASSIASGAQVILHGFLTQPFIPAGLIAGALATALAGLQIAAVKSAKPQKQFVTGTSGFQVPEGFPDDTFQVGLSSGERFKVETPTQQSSSNSDVIQQIDIYVGDDPVYRVVNRGIENRKIRIPA